MKETSKYLLKKFKSYNKILKNIDNLTAFYESTFKLLNTEQEELRSKYALGIMIDSWVNTFINNNGDNPADLNEMVLDNGKVLSNYMSFSMEKPDEDDKPTLLSLAIKKTTPETMNPILARNIVGDCKEKIKILNQSILENVVCIFEEYVSSIYTALLLNSPLDYIANKTVSFADIYSKKTEPILKIIEKEVEDKMYDSISCLKNLLEKNSINSNFVALELQEFNEIYYRRNIVVHNDGIINEKYIFNCDVKDSSLKVGDRVTCDEKYIKNSLHVLIKLLTCLEYEFGKILSIDEDTRLDALETYGFQCLSNKQYDLAEFIYNILKSDKKRIFAERLNYMINYLNAKKQQGKNINNELEKLDVSAVEDCYKIAKFCLENNDEKVFELLKDSYPNSFSAKNIRDWPIFINFRETEYYHKFVSLHKNDFISYDIADTKEIDEDNNDE